MSDPSLSYNQPHPSPIHSSPDTKPRHLSSLHFQDCRPIPDPHTPSKPAGTTSPPPKEMLPPSRSPSVPALPCKNSSPSFPPILPNISNKYFTFFCSLLFSNTQGRAREVRNRLSYIFVRICSESKRTKVYRKGGSNLVGSSRHFHNYVQKASPDSPKAARRGIFIITNKAPASPYNDASPPASYPLPSSGGSACFSHFHPASS